MRCKIFKIFASHQPIFRILRYYDQPVIKLLSISAPHYNQLHIMATNCRF